MSCNSPRECCYALSCDSEDFTEGQSRGRPCLQGRPARIAVVSSRAHEMGAIDLQDLHYRNRRYSSWGAYGELPLVVTIVMMIGFPHELFPAGCRQVQMILRLQACTKENAKA